MCLQEYLLSMQHYCLSKLDVIPDKLDAMVASMFHCDINNWLSPSGLLGASEAV